MVHFRQHATVFSCIMKASPSSHASMAVAWLPETFMPACRARCSGRVIQFWLPPVLLGSLLTSC